MKAEVQSHKSEARSARFSSSAPRRITHHASRFSRRRAGSHFALPTSAFISAFTLIELLVVLSIIALLAALAMPVLRNFKPNYGASATRQFLDDLARARQLAISQRTTVYMIFVPTNFWNDPAFTANQAWFTSQPNRLTNLLDKQTLAYTFVSLRSMGDQPGRPNPRYLSAWHTLPEGAYIAPIKFRPNSSLFTIYTNNASGALVPAFPIVGFDRTNTIPFPSEDVLNPPYTPKPNAPYVTVPYIAFDYMGRLASGNPAYPEIIPLANGNLIFARGPDHKGLESPPAYNEQPAGNATNSTAYNVVYIDRITGRARAIQQEVR